MKNKSFYLFTKYKWAQRALLEPGNTKKLKIKKKYFDQFAVKTFFIYFLIFILSTHNSIY